MPILSPTNLETAEYGTTGWNAIYSANFQKLNDYLSRLWDAISGLSSGENNKLLVYNHSQGKWTRRTLSGTTNQISVSITDTTITLSTPQDIHSGASPTFTRLTLTQPTGTAPLTVSSTTLVSNLNADLLDGFNSSQTPSANSVVVSKSDATIDKDWLPIFEDTKFRYVTTTVTTNTTLTASHSVVLVNASSNPITITLPSASGSNIVGKIYFIKKIDTSTNEVTIVPQSGQTIDGETSFKLFKQNETVSLVSNGINWFSLSTFANITYNVDYITSNITLTNNHFIVFVNASSSNITVTLPNAGANKGKSYIIKKIDNSNNQVILQPQSNNYIENQTSWSLTEENQIIEIVGDGINTWRIIRS